MLRRILITNVCGVAAQSSIYPQHSIDEIVSNLLVLNVILSLLFRVAFART